MSAYKDESKNTWFVKFSYKDLTGKTRNTTKRGFATKREALEYENEFKLKHSGSIDIGFEVFVQLYRENTYPRIRVSTQYKKDKIIDSLILPFFKNFKLADIQTRDIIHWQNQLIETVSETTGEKYSDTYLNTINSQLIALFNFAEKYYDLRTNPAKKAGTIGSVYGSEMQFWTYEEYKQFSEAMMEEPFYYYCFELLYWTGIREGEFLALTKDDFDFENQTLSITKTYQVIKGEQIVGPPKTPQSVRTVTMNEKLCEEMKDYFEMVYDPDSSSRAFPISRKGLASALARGAKRADVKRIRIHDLRHSHISLLINLGFSAVDIAKRVGHSSFTITLRYAHMFPSVEKDMAKKLNEINEDNQEDNNYVEEK